MMTSVLFILSGLWLIASVAIPGGLAWRARPRIARRLPAPPPESYDQAMTDLDDAVEKWISDHAPEAALPPAELDRTPAPAIERSAPAAAGNRTPGIPGDVRRHLRSARQRRLPGPAPTSPGDRGQPRQTDARDSPTRYFGDPSEYICAQCGPTGSLNAHYHNQQYHSGVQYARGPGRPWWAPQEPPPRGPDAGPIGDDWVR